LTVVGPEIPLVAGIVDAFQAEGLLIFGPNAAAAQLEGSKIFCKEILTAAAIPTAAYHHFNNAEEATEYIDSRKEGPLVIKADGLAAGKGVIVCKNKEESFAAVKLIGEEKAFGEAGEKIVVEDLLVGEEASVLAITDGKTIVALQVAQDHKPAYDGDTGPNTGGMGAYCPAPLVDDEMLAWIVEKVLLPTVHTLNRKETPFTGVLYAGLMITQHGPKVLEYNVRFGDPECQPLLMRLKSDLVEVFTKAAQGRLDEIEPLEWDERPAVCVVMASEGYPDAYAKGKEITGLEEAATVDDVKVFHAGTKLDIAGKSVTNGGRVLGVTGLGESISLAKLAAYTAVRKIRWEGAWCRKDIADKGIGEG